MDHDSRGETQDQILRDLFKAVPVPVQNFLRQRRNEGVAKELTTKYGLHLDQGTVLEREIILLLLGTQDIGEFIRTLVTTADIDIDIASNIAKDLNDLVFAPLYQEMRHSTISSQIDRAPVQHPTPLYQQQRPSVQAQHPVQLPSIAPRTMTPPPAPQPMVQPIVPPPSPKAQSVTPPPAPKPQPPVPSVWGTSDKVFIPANPALPQRPNDNMVTRVQRPRPMAPTPQQPSINVLNRSAGVPLQASTQQRVSAVPQSATQQPAVVPLPQQAPAIPTDFPPIPVPPDHMLNDHEEAQISQARKASEYTPPTNLPGMMPEPQPVPRPQVAVPPRSAPKTVLDRPTPPPQPRVPVAPYSTDPYREPIE